MLFNSHEFIFLFLPFTLFGFYFSGKRFGPEIAMLWLVFASLFFYAWWNPVYVWLIISSMLFNYGVGLALNICRFPKLLLAFGISANLFLLGYYKYANFFVNSINTLADTSFNLEHIFLPLAISFFTFQQIAYLVDTWQKKADEHNFLHYALFVSFFPQLIAGPIVHHGEMMRQFARKETFHWNNRNIELGLAIFSLGLFKKVVLADGIALYATPVFQAAGDGDMISVMDAWLGALSYSFQLYFDFSAYSDMAIGLGLLFGIQLPVNFMSPYKAVNIVDFWRRWHITLSRFLRDYLYIPLGGNKKGNARRYINLMITMLLGGLWHGAGWTFVFWGGLHGFYLVVNHAWHYLRRRLGSEPDQSGFLGQWAARIITFLAVVIGWVYFRAEDFSSANLILSSMFGFGQAEFLQSGLFSGTKIQQGWTFIAVLWFISWFLPSSLQWTGYIGEPKPSKPRWLPESLSSRLVFQTNGFWGLVSAGLLMYAIINMIHISEFLYFQF